MSLLATQTSAVLKLFGPYCRLGDRTLTVSYAEPKQSEMNQDQVKSVYVGGLTAGASEKELKEVFETLSMGSVCSMPLQFA